MTLGMVARSAALLTVLGVIAAVPASASARDGASPAKRPQVVLMNEPVGCSDSFQRLVCAGFTRAAKRAGVDGRIVTPSKREDPVDTLELLARQNHDLVVVFGFASYDALEKVAVLHRGARFAALDRSHRDIGSRPRNVQGIIFRTSEAAFLAGWLAARLERLRPGPDVVGVVPGVPIPAVEDFVVGFRAGARRASSRVKVLVSYSHNFLDAKSCKALARQQIARGAGAVFNVAGACGLGTLEAAKETGVWGIGVDTDQSFLGPHVLTSVLKRYEDGLVAVLSRLKAGNLRTGGDTVLTLREGAVGLGKVSRKVPASLRKQLAKLGRRVARGEIRVPGAFADPR